MDPGTLELFVRDDGGYLRWLEEHPNGYVVNCEPTPKPSYIKLHHAGCVFLQPERSQNWTESYAKVCASSVGVLDRWALAEVGVVADRCPYCRP